MDLSTIVVAAAHLLATGGTPYHGHDHLAELLPQNSQILVVHQNAPRATGWLGLDDNVRRGCDSLNSLLDCERNKENSLYRQVQKPLRDITMTDETQDYLDFYQLSNQVRESLEMILPGDVHEDVRSHEYTLVLQALRKIKVEKEHSR